MSQSHTGFMELTQNMYLFDLMTIINNLHSPAAAIIFYSCDRNKSYGCNLNFELASYG